MMFSKIKAVLAIALLIGAPIAAQAGTTPQTFTVTANLTSSCTVAGANAHTFNYTGMQGSAITNEAAGTVTFTCTRGLTPTVVWDATNGSTTAAGATATATGTAAGIVYTLATGAVTTTAGTAATTTVGATATTHAYSLLLSAAANQPGDASVATTSVRTLTLSY
jgi:spore coat protein U-like protein